MFFVKLEGSDLQRLLKVAAEKGLSVERLARLAFLKGLRLLMKEASDDPGLAYPLDGRFKKPPEEVREYIRQHYESESDETMAEALGYSRISIRVKRLEMGLKRPVGRSRISYEQLELLIRKHWESKNDAEIARLMEPAVSPMTVFRYRCSLGLRKTKGQRGENLIRAKVDPAELKRMVCHDGYTLTDYIRIKGLSCSRERLRQLAVELGVETAKEGRIPEWGLNRRARELGKPDLANRELLSEQLSKAVSVQSLAADLGVKEKDFTSSSGSSGSPIRKSVSTGS